MVTGRGLGELTSLYFTAAGTGLCILFSASVSYGRLVQVRAWHFIVELVASRKHLTNSAFADPPFFLLPDEDIQELQTPNCRETCSTLSYKCTTFSLVLNREYFYTYKGIMAHSGLWLVILLVIAQGDVKSGMTHTGTVTLSCTFTTLLVSITSPSCTIVIKLALRIHHIIGRGQPSIRQILSYSISSPMTRSCKYTSLEPYQHLGNFEFMSHGSVWDISPFHLRMHHHSFECSILYFLIELVFHWNMSGKCQCRVKLQQRVLCF